MLPVVTVLPVGSVTCHFDCMVHGKLVTCDVLVLHIIKGMYVVMTVAQASWQVLLGP